MSRDIVSRMRELADSGHPRANELRAKADDLDRKIESDEDPRSAARALLGAWARARMLWRDVTGEPLI